MRWPIAFAIVALLQCAGAYLDRPLCGTDEQCQAQLADAERERVYLEDVKREADARN